MAAPETNRSASEPNNASSALQCFAVEKSFFGVKVLKAVSLVVPAGHTLGLVGENGAGKSTLMNILGGNLQADAGHLRLNGHPYEPRNPHHAAAAGIAFIHQELNLFSNLSIAENLFLTSFPTRAGLIHRVDLRKLTANLLDEVGLHLDPGTQLHRLSAGERQLVEIAKALSIQPRLIILDEPTTSLTIRETEHLFGLLGRLRQRGHAMIYISHALNDILQLCDDIVVLRDGEVAGAGARAEFTVERMVSLMVGREITQLFPKRKPQTSKRVVLEVERVSQPGIVKDISFQLRSGEVLGISGLMGSGRTELARILFGLDPMKSGAIRLEEKRIDSLSPKQRIERGLAFLTESRREEGLCMEAAIADNISLVCAPRQARGLLGWLDRDGINRVVSRIRQAVTLTASARNEQSVNTLSGGNQQKVVLAKWLANEPKVFILDEPTRGIDVGAKFEVYTLINQLAERGAGVLLISSEIEELIGLCDRILVMTRGEIRDEIQCADFDRERILTAALHGGRINLEPQPREDEA